MTISRDRERSLVVVVSVAYYGVSGVARGAEFFGENVTGRMVFASKCTGRLSALKEVKASFQTVVDSEGFRTKVWRDEPGTATKGK